MIHPDAQGFSAISFDYVVVGGGIGGLTLAARLSENPNVNVGPEINIPGYFGRTIGNPDVDWMFQTVPQRGLHNRTIFQARGKILGGSSAMNFMSFSRCSTRDEYNALETLGNPGWNWDNLLPYFKKSENLTVPPSAMADKYQIRPDPEFHGTNGPVHATYPIWYSDLHDPFMEALGVLDVPPNLDPQNGHNVGRYVASAAIDPKSVTRSYPVSAYFEPNKDRPNLHILTGAHVTKVLTSPQSGTVVATAVQFRHENELFLAKAQREIILCAGSYQTPQLLELSGIGNPQILQKISIETVVDLPGVGENLQDHPYVPVIREVTSETQTYETLADPGVLEEQAALYHTKKEGMFSSVHTGFAMARTKLKQSLASMVDTQSGTALSKQLALQRQWLDDPNYAQLELINLPAWLPTGDPGEMISPDPGAHYHSVIPVLPHPLSRGTVHITSADPFAHPAIDPNYLSNPGKSSRRGPEMMVHAVKFSQKVMITGGLKESHVKFAQPGPDVTSHDDLKAWVTKYGTATWHPLGTASMLPRADGGVVDSNLIVYGTKNLRVVDASILPLHMSCHPQSTIYALAEKAADIIRGAYHQ
ncbi:GMC oxidoreductase [Infundibulicybe gibba]|nr:GMC oxidoreductase [Infundibulicybe gibba]